MITENVMFGLVLLILSYELVDMFDTINHGSSTEIQHLEISDSSLHN